MLAQLRTYVHVRHVPVGRGRDMARPREDRVVEQCHGQVHSITVNPFALETRCARETV
jgi:hypothetical protein